MNTLLSPTTRRAFLRASGVIVGLPFLESLPAARAGGQASKARCRRLVAINVGLGLHAPNFIPTSAGSDYALPAYLQELGNLRNHFTLFSGTSHPEVGGGHLSYKSFLTGAPHPSSAGFRNTISLDQLAASELGGETRFASLSLSNTGPGLSWSRSGVEIPSYTRPSQVFQKLFLTGKPSEQAAQLHRLREGRSVLDTVMNRTRRLEAQLTARDKEKLDQYFESVREAEQRLAKAEVWENRPKPSPGAPEPRDETDSRKILEKMRLLYQIMHLALETDSTRFITLNLPGMNAVPVIPGIDMDYHNLSHHGRDPEKIRQLTMVERAVVKEFATFLGRLNESRMEGGTLLDSTMVLFGSNLGNASSHDTRNLPILLAGGGFRHGKHIAFHPDQNHPLTNLHVSMLRQLGLEVQSFATGTQPIPGLEPA